MYTVRSSIAQSAITFEIFVTVCRRHCIYYEGKGDEIFRWAHAWVRIGDELIDGNVDSLSENPRVPKSVSVAPYWGPIGEVPIDRRLREDHGAILRSDVDVEGYLVARIAKMD